MANRREAPAWFVQRLRGFPDFVEVRFNDLLYRWEFITLSVAGKPVSQFFGWDRNPFNGQKIEPDPVTGLLPFRDLTPDACNEILDSMEKTFIGNRQDGAGTWKRKAEQARRHNREEIRKRAERRADDFAYLIKQVDLRRPWVKFHRKKRNGSPAV